MITAGRYKGELADYLPLSDDARNFIQSQVSAYYEKFVAEGRGVSSGDVRNGFGQGRMVLAREAFRARMVDRVATFDETVCSPE
jgi:protease-4